MKIAQNLPSTIFIILIENVNHRFSHSGEGGGGHGGEAGGGGLGGEAPPPYPTTFFENLPPSKSMPPHLEKNPPSEKQTLSLKSEAPFHEKIPRKSTLYNSLKSSLNPWKMCEEVHF